MRQLTARVFEIKLAMQGVDQRVQIQNEETTETSDDSAVAMQDEAAIGREEAQSPIK